MTTTTAKMGRLPDGGYFVEGDFPPGSTVSVAEGGGCSIAVGSKRPELDRLHAEIDALEAALLAVEIQELAAEVEQAGENVAQAEREIAEAADEPHPGGSDSR